MFGNGYSENINGATLRTVIFIIKYTWHTQKLINKNGLWIFWTVDCAE